MRDVLVLSGKNPLHSFSLPSEYEFPASETWLGIEVVLLGVSFAFVSSSEGSEQYDFMSYPCKRLIV